jgi:hypothetical protein
MSAICELAMKARSLYHVSGLDVRSDQDVRVDCDRRIDVLDLGSFGVDGGIRIEGPSTIPPTICRRSGHLGEDRAVQRRGHTGADGVSTAASTATFGTGMPKARAKPISFWQISRF